MRAWMTAAVLAISWLGAAPAVAQSAAPDVQAAARARGEEGLRLFEASRWAEAFEAFERADAIFHAPTLVLYMAKCRANQGKLLEARALYERAASERLDSAAPPRFRKAQASARDELEALRKRVPRIVARISGASTGSARATLDGAAVTAAALADGKEIDPGHHVLTAEADGARPARVELDVKEGDAPTLELALVSAPGGAPVLAPQTDGGRPSLLLAEVAFGVGGVGLLLGAVSGGIALGKIADVKSRCVAGDCLVSDIPERDHAKALVAVSTVGLVAGGAGLAAGTVLMLLRARHPDAAASPPIGLAVGPGSITAWGRF